LPSISGLYYVPFPAPGVELSGNVYCCDNCARGPSGKKKGMMLVMPFLLFGAGVAGAYGQGDDR